MTHLTQDKRRKTMQALNATMFLEKVGHAVVNGALLAALPTAMVAILLQAF